MEELGIKRAQQSDRVTGGKRIAGGVKCTKNEKKDVLQQRRQVRQDKDGQC